MDRLSDAAIEIINTLHRERIDYNSEYLPLIEAVNRLSAYEDTGLEPNEIEKALNAMKSALGLACELQSYRDAERENRMVVFPFTIGTTLYRVTTPYRKELKVTEFIVTNFVMRGKKHELMVEVRVNGVPGTNIMKIKSFYRTREEAEAALKGDGEK